MKYELLLTWVSERATGTWHEFRDAHDWLFNSGQLDGKQVHATTTIHALSMLGHLEIDWNIGAWAATAPTLTILPNAGAHAVLTGVRNRWLCEALDAAAASEDYFFESCAQQWGPDAVFVAASDETAVEKLAEQTGISFEPCVS